MTAGMEILFSTVKAHLTGPVDTLVCCLHWNMVSEGFKCIGKGENAPTSEDGIKLSEMLPDGWNESQDDYSLLYRRPGSTDTFILKVIRIEEQLLVHVLRIKDEKIANLTVNIGDYTTEDLSSFEMACKNLENLQKEFKKEIIDALSQESTSSQAKGQQSSSSLQSGRARPSDPHHDPLRVGPAGGRIRPTPNWGEDPFVVGRGDLDPFAGGRGGGMLMDPFRGGMGGPQRGDPSAGLPGRLPPGAVPPGARFDPFGPPGAGPMGPGAGGHRAGPDPDHLPPPGFDDMFM